MVFIIFFIFWVELFSTDWLILLCSFTLEVYWARLEWWKSYQRVVFEEHLQEIFLASLLNLHSSFLLLFLLPPFCRYWECIERLPLKWTNSHVIFYLLGSISTALIFSRSSQNAWLKVWEWTESCWLISAAPVLLMIKSHYWGIYLLMRWIEGRFWWSWEGLYELISLMNFWWDVPRLEQSKEDALYRAD